MYKVVVVMLVVVVGMVVIVDKKFVKYTTVHFEENIIAIEGKW